MVALGATPRTPMVLSRAAITPATFVPWCSAGTVGVAAAPVIVIERAVDVGR